MAISAKKLAAISAAIGAYLAERAQQQNPLGQGGWRTSGRQEAMAQKWAMQNRVARVALRG